MNQNILGYNISNFPSVLNGVTTSADYLSVFTQSYSDSAYVMSFTITAYTPDKRISAFVSALVYINQFLPKAFFYPFNKFIFVQVDSINTFENLTLVLKNYFSFG